MQFKYLTKKFKKFLKSNNADISTTNDVTKRHIVLLCICFLTKISFISLDRHGIKLPQIFEPCIGLKMLTKKLR